MREKGKHLMPYQQFVPSAEEQELSLVRKNLHPVCGIIFFKINANVNGKRVNGKNLMFLTK